MEERTGPPTKEMYVVADCENALSAKKTEVKLSRSFFYPLNFITVLCRGYSYVLVFTKVVQSYDHHLQCMYCTDERNFGALSRNILGI